MALMSAVGVGSTINLYWLQPLAIALLLFSVSALFLGARRRQGYGPFIAGLFAAIAIYFSKFTLNYDIGVYLGGVTLLGASIWNAVWSAPACRSSGACRSAGESAARSAHSKSLKGEPHGL
jgi:hypothetical protein